MILGGTKIRSDAKRADKLPLGLVQAGTAGYREKRNGMVRGMCRLKGFLLLFLLSFLSLQSKIYISG